MSNKLYKCIALNSRKAMVTSSDGMIEKVKLAKVIFIYALIVAIASNSFWVEIIHAQRMNTQALEGDDDILITFTNSSFTIDSVSEYGNFSFTFDWENTGLKIEYNRTPREMKYLECINFTDKTAKYRMEYWVPTTLYEYIDVDGNDYLDDIDPIIAMYKIHENIAMTNITTREYANGIPVCEWSYTQAAMPMEPNLHAPWERFPVVEENFHYYPLNGTLKMDIILKNYGDPRNEFYKSENLSSRIFISYKVRYMPLESNNATVTVVFDDQELIYDQINRTYPTTSNVIIFKVNGEKRGFFDFGGNVTIDGFPNMHVNGSIEPAYYDYYENKWLQIGLNYPHVNQTMIHDPYFGLFQHYSGRPSPIAVTLPFEWTVVTTVISVIICTVAIVDYFRTKSRYFQVR